MVNVYEWTGIALQTMGRIIMLVLAVMLALALIFLTGVCIYAVIKQVATGIKKRIRKEEEKKDE